MKTEGTVKLHFGAASERSARILEIPTDRNLNLLGHAQCEEAFLGSRCGGHGKCGADKLRILRGYACLNPVTEAERRLLKPEEISANIRLGCQSFPNETIDEIEAEVLSPDARFNE